MDLPKTAEQSIESSPHSNVSSYVDHPDLGIDRGLDLRPLLPPGKYTVGFLEAKREKKWKREMILLWFVICDLGEYQGQKLFMSCGVPPKSKKWTLGYKYVKNWIMAAERRPDRFDRALTPRVFQKKWFLAKVKTVTQSEKNMPLPQLAQYSVIEDLIDRF